ncbi:hypothetical protein M408DRAFT_169603 [Serendipita vermifera MAFF 305830]|uniref:Uncharacterized protein n=1 Tax=Serendipita vermifera MAFF 305830 TaxID=933852 RepID=A0A0C3B5C7_SERVB|nr:hypothetical protein M408DRAFT_169603 [Serendipita vermifera MAFF 305830]
MVKIKKNLKLASFDGGGIRALSQVEIMNNIMYRLNWDDEEDESERPTLPCEHFDLMGGSGTGGLLVLLFTKLRMSVEEASEVLSTIATQVYGNNQMEPSQRSMKLRKCLEDALKEK